MAPPIGAPPDAIPFPVARDVGRCGRRLMARGRSTERSERAGSVRTVSVESSRSAGPHVCTMYASVAYCPVLPGATGSGRHAVGLLRPDRAAHEHPRAHPDLTTDQLICAGTSHGAATTTSCSDGSHGLRHQPLRDLVGIEAEQVAPLQVRNAPLGDEATDMPHADAKMFGDFVDVHEPRQARRTHTARRAWSWAVLGRATALRRSVRSAPGLRSGRLGLHDEDDLPSANSSPTNKPHPRPSIRPRFSIRPRSCRRSAARAETMRRRRCRFGRQRPSRFRRPALR